MHMQQQAIYLTQGMPCAAGRERRRTGRACMLGIACMLRLGGKLWGDAAGPVAQPQQTSRMLAPGQPAPNFVAATLDGQEMTLQAYHGRPVIINFWATWCE